MKHLTGFLSSLDSDTIRHGSHKENEGAITVRAGDLSMLLENGCLRYISRGNIEIIRMIYPAVRDSVWNTIKPVITIRENNVNERSFIFSCDSLYRCGGINFAARITLEGKDDSTIILSMKGEALSGFRKNRIGFCVLHPSGSYSGKPCSIIHPGGIVESSCFPELVSPHQPFREIESMKWQVDGAMYTLDFYGDLFETEDQRNWTDSSFKTYSTPLSLPFPVTVEKGTVIEQKIVLTTKNSIAREKENTDAIRITFHPEESGAMPSIGFSKPSALRPLGETEIKILRLLHPGHYRVDLLLFETGWENRADEAFTESNALHAPMELALFFDDNAEGQLSGFLEWREKRKPDIKVILVFHKNHGSTPSWLSRLVIPQLKKAMAGILTGTGTNANFAQLNMERPTDEGNDLICYSVHPQEHASDNLTLVENLMAQAECTESAAVFAGGKGIWISPVTIQRRFNANISFYEDISSPELVKAGTDSRMMSLLGACWSAGSLKYLLESAVGGITFFEASGERGVIQGDYDPSINKDFRSVRGMIFPAWFVFKFILDNRPMKILKSSSSEHLAADSLVLTDGKQVRAMIMNYTPESREVTIEGCTGMFRVRALNEKTFAEAAADHLWTGKADEKTVNSLKPFSADPYSVTFIEGWLRH